MTDRKLRNDVDETTELAESVSKRLRDTWGLDAIDTAEINLVVRQEIDRIQKKRGDAWSTHPMLSTCGMCMQIGRKNCTCPCHADDVAAGSGKSVEI